MSRLNLELLAVTFFLLLVIFLLSIIESAAFRMSRLSLRVLAEREKNTRIHLLEEIARDRIEFLLPIQFACQILLGVVAILATLIFLERGWPYAPVWAGLTLAAVVFLVRQFLPRLITRSEPERVLLRCLPLFKGFYRVLRWTSAPLLRLLKVPPVYDEKEEPAFGPAEEEDASEEEIQAYLGVGEEEGIFEEEESKLIQSALEFGDILVREIMTPRMELVAIEENATLGELKDLMVSSKFSRIPVYRERLDQIIGIVYMRNLLGYLDGKLNDPITPLIGEAWIVPETKKVSDLLKEMQLNAQHMAIVINEYASISGLVTIEDVIEEIVGEIRDEDESEQVDLVYEGEGNYLVRGGTEIEELEEALSVDFGEVDVTTVSGLIVAHLGKVPSTGEKITLDGVEIQILSSDRKKIQSMRIRRPAPVAEEESPED